MSVSFYPEIVSDSPHRVMCICGNFTGEEFPSRLLAHASIESRDASEVCSECLLLTYEPVDPEPEVQMSNSNAVDLLDLLGIKNGKDFAERCAGSMSAEELMERALLAEGFAPENSGLTTMRIDNVVYSGRPDNYIAQKLAGIRSLAEWALSNGRKVIWS